MIKKKMFILLGILTLFLIPFVSANLGKLSIQESSPRWNVVYSTDYDYKVYVADKNSQKTEICLLSKTATKLQDLPESHKNIYDEEGNILVTLNSKMKRLDKDYFGWCRIIEDEIYLKFGEHSTVIVFQNESRIEYNHEDYNINVTLYKNITGEFDTDVNNIFVFLNPDLYKFGANDTSNEGLEQYKYLIHADQSLYVDNNDIYVLVNKGDKIVKHNCDLSDICDKNYSECQINKVDEDEYEVIFYSDSFIDPIITVSEFASHDLDIEYLNETVFLVGTTFSNAISVYKYDINGTLLGNQTIITGVGSQARVDIAKKNETYFIVSFYDSINQNISFQDFDDNLISLSSIHAHEQVGLATDLQAFIYDNQLVICHINDLVNDADFTSFNLTDYSEIYDIAVDTGINPASILSNTASCSPFGNDFVISFFDDNANTDFFNIYNINGSQVLSRVNYDSSAGETSNLDLVAFNTTSFFIGFTDTGIGDDYFEYYIYDKMENILISNSSVKLLNDLENSRVAVTSIYNGTTNKNDIIFAFDDFPDNKIYANIYDSDGILLSSLELVDDINSTYPNFDIYSKEVIYQIGSLNDTFTLAYTNSTGTTKVINYFRNGTIFSQISFVSNVTNLTIEQLVNSSLTVPSYPYVDIYTSYPLKVIYQLNSSNIDLDNVFINISNPYGNSSLYGLNYNSSDVSYYILFNFTDSGNYPFNIYALDGVYSNIENITGVFIVRDPFYITFNFYDSLENSTWFSSNKYENNFAYLIAEYKEDRYYDGYIENFVAPLFFKSTYDLDVFHARLIGGTATLKLYDANTSYALRLIDGEITFEDSFSPPNMTKSYGTNFYVGLFNFSGIDETYNIYVTEKDIHQYRYLLNWIFVGGLVIALFTSIILFFVIPEIPVLSVMFGIGFSSLLTLLRVVIFIWKGW